MCAPSNGAVADEVPDPYRPDLGSKANAIAFDMVDTRTKPKGQRELCDLVPRGGSGKIDDFVYHDGTKQGRPAAQYFVRKVTICRHSTYVKGC